MNRKSFLRRLAGVLVIAFTAKPTVVQASPHSVDDWVIYDDNEPSVKGCMSNAIPMHADEMYLKFSQGIDPEVVCHPQHRSIKLSVVQNGKEISAVFKKEGEPFSKVLKKLPFVWVDDYNRGLALGRLIGAYRGRYGSPYVKYTRTVQL